MATQPCGQRTATTDEPCTHVVDGHTPWCSAGHRNPRYQLRPAAAGLAASSAAAVSDIDDLVPASQRQLGRHVQISEQRLDELVGLLEEDGVLEFHDPDDVDGFVDALVGINDADICPFDLPAGATLIAYRVHSDCDRGYVFAMRPAAAAGVGGQMVNVASLFIDQRDIDPGGRDDRSRARGIASNVAFELDRLAPAYQAAFGAAAGPAA